MGKKWIYRLKKEDFAHVAQRLNVAETENDPQLVDIWAELEETYHDRAGPSITLTNAEGDNLVASLSFDNMQKERESSQDKKTTALTPRPSQSDYAKVAKQVREWSFRFDGAEKPFEFHLRKLPHLFSAKRFLHQASETGPATEARLQRVVQGLHDRHANDGEAT